MSNGFSFCPANDIFQVLLLLGSAVILLLTVPKAMAHNYSPSFIWDTDDTITVESRIPQSTDVHSAADDYDNNTDLNVNRCTPNGNCGNVIHYDGNYGSSEPPAWADPLSQMEPCSDDDHVLNGYCNETNHKVDFSYIYYNTHSYATNLVAYYARHEMGHVWGLDHVACSTASVMWINACSGSVWGVLTSHDRSDVNSKY